MNALRNINLNNITIPESISQINRPDETTTTLPGNIGGATYNSDGDLPNTLEPLGEGESNDEE